MTAPAPCVFCEIVEFKAPAKVLVAYQHSVVIEPLDPVTPGHALVIPDTHVTDAREVQNVTAVAFRDAAAYLQFLREDREVHGERLAKIEDFNLITSGGPSATQTIEHLHVHIVPRREGDGLHLPWTGQHKTPQVGMEWDHRKHDAMVDGTVVTDRYDRQWTVCRDGGMAERTDSEGQIQSAGIVWLERNHGPLLVQSVPEAEQQQSTLARSKAEVSDSLRALGERTPPVRGFHRCSRPTCGHTLIAHSGVFGCIHCGPERCVEFVPPTPEDVKI